MLNRLIVAVVIAIVVTLVCMLVGAILVTLKIDAAVTVGEFLKQWGAVIGVVAELYAFATNRTWPL